MPSADQPNKVPLSRRRGWRNLTRPQVEEFEVAIGGLRDSVELLGITALFRWSLAPESLQVKRQLLVVFDGEQVSRISDHGIKDDIVLYQIFSNFTPADSCFQPLDNCLSFHRLWLMRNKRSPEVRILLEIRNYRVQKCVEQRIVRLWSTNLGAKLFNRDQVRFEIRGEPDRSSS